MARRYVRIHTRSHGVQCTYRSRRDSDPVLRPERQVASRDNTRRFFLSTSVPGSRRPSRSYGRSVRSGHQSSRSGHQWAALSGCQKLNVKPNSGAAAVINLVVLESRFTWAGLRRQWSTGRTCSIMCTPEYCDLKDYTYYSSILWVRMRVIRGSTVNIRTSTNGRVSAI